MTRDFDLDFDYLRARLADWSLARLVKQCVDSADTAHLDALVTPGAAWTYWEDAVGDLVWEDGNVGKPMEEDYIAAMMLLVAYIEARGVTACPPTWLVEVAKDLERNT